MSSSQPRGEKVLGEMASEFRMEIALSGAQDMGDFQVRALPSEDFKDGLNLTFLLRVLWPQDTAALHSEDPG